MTASVCGIEWAMSLALDAVQAMASSCVEGASAAQVIAAGDDLAAEMERRACASAPVDVDEPIAAVLDRLLGMPAMASDAFAALRSLRDAQRAISWGEARLDAAMIAIAGAVRHTQRVHLAGVGVTVIEDPARSEIALALRWSEAFASQRLHTARLLLAYAPATRAALSAGAVSQAQATAIASGVARLATGLGIDPVAGEDRDGASRRLLVELSAQLDTRATAIARRSELGHTRAAVIRIVDSLHREGATLRRRGAARQRGVWIQAEPDGNALLIARMATSQAVACVEAIRQGATALRQHRQEAGEPDARTIGEIRADLLANVILGSPGTAGDDTTDAAPVATHIDVVISLESLLGLTDQAATLHGAGLEETMPAAEVRDLIAAGGDITLRRLVTDPLTGHLLDAAPRRYALSVGLRDFITSRDQRCRWPGCHTRAHSSDIDHAIAFDTGGDSTRTNLGALCRRHHRLKTHADYNITDSDDDGSCTITTPSGHAYPHAVVPVLQDDDPPPF